MQGACVRQIGGIVFATARPESKLSWRNEYRADDLFCGWKTFV